MPDNPTPHGAPAIALPDHQVLALSGPDAAAFAQAQFMNDVSALADGQWQWNGWLTPKGRVIALFALLRLDAETLWLLLPDADPQALVAALQRYVFRSKVVLAVQGELRASGLFTAPLDASSNRLARQDDGSLELDLSGDGGARSLILGANQAKPDPAQEARWAQQDLAHGLPRLQADQVEAWTPQQLSLERLRAFSVKKGCYPGQEIVARTHFLGQVKRGLALFEAASPIAAGAEVRNDERALGTVTCTAGPLALAVLPLDADTTSLQANGIALAPRTLLDGLQR